MYLLRRKDLIVKRNLVNLVTFGSILIISSSCLSGIHLLGIDQEGEKDLKVSKNDYAEKIGITLADLHDAALGPANEIAYSRSGEQWKVKWFNIGMGIEGKVGLAGIATLAAKPRIRLYFLKKSL